MGVSDGEHLAHLFQCLARRGLHLVLLPILDLGLPGHGQDHIQDHPLTARIPAIPPGTARILAADQGLDHSHLHLPQLPLHHEQKMLQEQRPKAEQLSVVERAMPQLPLAKVKKL